MMIRPVQPLHSFYAGWTPLQETSHGRRQLGMKDYRLAGLRERAKSLARGCSCTRFDR